MKFLPTRVFATPKPRPWNDKLSTLDLRDLKYEMRTEFYNLRQKLWNEDLYQYEFYYSKTTFFKKIGVMYSQRIYHRDGLANKHVADVCVKLHPIKEENGLTTYECHYYVTFEKNRHRKYKISSFDEIKSLLLV